MGSCHAHRRGSSRHSLLNDFVKVDRATIQVRPKVYEKMNPLSRRGHFEAGYTDQESVTPRYGKNAAVNDRISAIGLFLR